MGGKVIIFFFQAEDGIRDVAVTGVQTCALPIFAARLRGTHLVSTKHNDDPFRVGPFRFVERGLSHLADRVITITDALHRFTVERVGVPAGKVETIHYGLDGIPEAWGA